MKNFKILFISLILVGMSIPHSASAMTPEEKGLAITVEDDNRLLLSPVHCEIIV